MIGAGATTMPRWEIAFENAQAQQGLGRRQQRSGAFGSDRDLPPRRKAAKVQHAARAAPRARLDDCARHNAALAAGPTRPGRL